VVPAAESGAQIPDDAETRALVERVRARWAAKLKRDFTTAYGFESPEYRAENSADAYAARYGGMVKWHGVDITSVRYDDDGAATVYVDVDHTVHSPFDAGDIRQSITMTERWSRSDGTRYHVIEKRSPVGVPREVDQSATEREVDANETETD
jgi:hypothetical protein